MKPTPEARTKHEEKKEAKRAEKEKWASLTASPTDNEMTAEQQWQHMWELQQLPRTPGTSGAVKSPITPRTQAFGALEGHSTHASPEIKQEWYPPPPQPQQQPVRGLGVSHGDVSPVEEYDEYVGKGHAY